MDAPTPGPPADPVAEAWEKVDRAWTDPDAHRRFIALCLSLDRLADAGTRYRHVRDADPSRRVVAEARIQEILAAATQRMLLQRSQPPHDLRRGVRLLAVVVSVAMMAAAAWVWLRGL